MMWADFFMEFKMNFFNLTAMSAQQTKFLNLKQESMTVAKADRNLERLAKLCPYMVPTEEQWTKRMLEMFRSDISLAIESSGDQPVTTIDCVERADRAKIQLNKLREIQNRLFESRRKQGNRVGNQENIWNQNP